MMDGYDMNGWGWFGMLMMVIGTAAIVGLVVWAIGGSHGSADTVGESRRWLDLETREA